MTNSFDFLYPRSRYHGEVKPENLVFNANLQEFAQRVNFIVALESNGKLAPEVAYAEIEALWNKLQRSKRQLEIGNNPFEGPENKAA
ncbi:MAG: hypothetical protein F6J93_27360 [Oscillatoria sp. SIO1A7]|nr:hypothetical protein [Oscillatoria sp. SIO1A7]